MARRNVKPSEWFTMVRRVIWRSKRFTALPDDSARLLFFYYLTHPHQTHTGCFVIPDNYALTDLT